MIGRSRHLHDDRLYECYFAERTGDAIEPRVAEHLADCAKCAARYGEFSSFVTEVSREGVDEADAVFTTDRLQHQHETIMRRLDLAGRPARVISFPGQAAAAGAGASGRVAPRWLAAAAAAGLFVGVAVGGTFVPSRNPLSSANRPSAPAATRVAPAPVRVLVPAPVASETIDDDRFLLELEVALARPRTRELLSFDNLTPRAREIGSRAR